MTTVRGDIKEAKDALKAIMQENLVIAAAGMIDQIVSFRKSNVDSKRFDATKDLTFTGATLYKQDLLEALAMIAAEALARARKEVPSKKNIKLSDVDEESLKLGEWEKLPSDLRLRLQRQMQQLVDAQQADLQKVLAFQYTGSVDSTGDLAVLKKDLSDSADDYIGGPAIEAGASVTAAQITNEARSAFFFDDEVLAELDAFQFINGDPVTPICQELANTIFAKDDPDLDRYQPPLHWNCKSYIVPILKGNLGNKEIKPVELSKKAQGSIQFSECDCANHELDYLNTRPKEMLK